MSDKNMPSFTKHLLQAYINWTNEVDGKCFIQIHKDNIKEPALLEYVSKNGYLTLNIGGDAPRNLFLGEDYLSVDLRFKGENVNVHLNYLDIYGVSAPEVLEFLMPLTIIPILTTGGPTLAQILPNPTDYDPLEFGQGQGGDNVVALFPARKPT